MASDMTAATERVRGRAWQRIRREVLMAEPLCRICLASDRVTAAQEVDHITPLHLGGHATERGNLRALCRQCHVDVTNEAMGHRVKVNTGLDGWPNAG
jgi:5-methylcytosine-specific restriction endonuclease McrA